MSKHRTYLDYNASAPLRPEAAKAMQLVWQTPGNASSVHAEGRRYRYGHQGQIAQWNLWQLANALFPLIEDADALRPHGWGGGCM